MPLRALLDGLDIHSFEFDELAWENLKMTYKAHSLVMPCCGHSAFPKTSTLGNFFFAHKSGSHCPYVADSPEHLYLKFLIAQQATDAGWSVMTEKQIGMFDGIPAVADVYCTRNNVSLAFMVQFPQCDDRWIEDRQAEFTEAGIHRTLWLRKLRKRSEYYSHGIYQDYNLPVFGIRQNESGDFYLPQFDVCVDDFIAGVFAGKLSWFPDRRKPLIASIQPRTVNCRRCRKPTNIIERIGICDHSGMFVADLFFGDERAKDLLQENMNCLNLNSRGIGQLKSRRRSYGISNGCWHCDTLISDDSLYYSGNDGKVATSNSMIEFKFDYDGAFYLPEFWLFDGKKSKAIF
ncbi:hypothetical protein [Citrobacter amalonaticus]|uniref:hypothetical protein n=1 Tax=Citrobacter amalonaticus TaxID=35703 RepID=UPI00300D8E22